VSGATVAMRHRLQLLSVAGVEATRGVPLYAGILMVAVSALAAGSLGALAPGWAGPLSNGGATATFLAPIIAGTAVVHVQVRRRKGWLDAAASTSRGVAGAVSLSALSLFAVSVVALTVGEVVAIVRADLAGPFTPAMLLLPAMALAMCGASVALGVWLGTMTHRKLAGPALSIALYATGTAWNFLRIDGRSWLLWLEPYPLDFFYSIATEPNPSFWLPKIAALTAVAIAVLLWLNRHRALSTLTAIAGVAALVAAATSTQLEVVQERTPPPDPPCLQQSGVTVCTWPEATGPAPNILAAAVQLRADNDAILPSMPTTYTQVGLETVLPEAATVDVLTTEDPRYIMGEVRAASLPPTSCPDLEVPGALRNDVVVLMVARAGEPVIDEPEIEALARQPDAVQARWVNDKIEDAEAACSTRPGNTP